jgi:hypothetical protein
MIQNRKIILFSLIFSLVAFISTAKGSQDTVAPGGRSPQGNPQSGGQNMPRPSDSEITIFNSQFNV